MSAMRIVLFVLRKNFSPTNDTKQKIVDDNFAAIGNNNLKRSRAK
jgi:hypothetical protein